LYHRENRVIHVIHTPYGDDESSALFNKENSTNRSFGFPQARMGPCRTVAVGFATTQNDSWPPPEMVVTDHA